MRLECYTSHQIQKLMWKLKHQTLRRTQRGIPLKICAKQRFIEQEQKAFTIKHWHTNFIKIKNFCSSRDNIKKVKKKSRLGKDMQNI